MKTLTTITALAALAWLPPTSTASAQETRKMTIEETIAEEAMTIEETIAEEATTIEEALEALQREEGLQSQGPGVRLLRQVTLLGIPVNPLPAAELDAFADRLAAMVLDPTLPEHVRNNAAAVLAGAASGNRRGTPYARAFDLLVRAYEGGYDDALALGNIFWSDPERGPAYVRGVFERSERPPVCQWWHDDDRGWRPIVGGASRIPGDDLPPECDGYSFRRDARPTPWCRAGDLLFRDVVSEASERTPRRPWPRYAWPQPIPDGLPEHVEDWHRRCR